MGQSRIRGRKTLGALSLGVAMFGVTLGCATVPASAADIAGVVEESHALVKKGDTKTALIKLKKAVKDNPNNADLRIELGSAEFQTGDLLAAEAELKVARSLGGPIERINPLMASAMYYQGKLDELIRTIQPCLDDAPCKAGVLSIHARAHLALKQIGLAEADIKAALETSPSDPDVKLANALVQMAQGENSKAEATVDEVLAARPRSIEALVTKGDLRRSASDFAGAEKAFTSAVEINPRNFNTRLRLAIAQLAEGKNQEAQTNIDKVLADAPKAILATYLKALMLTRSNKMRQALEAVRPVEAEIAKTPQGMFLLAVIHNGNNNLEEALKYAQSYHAAVPDNMVGVRLEANLEFALRDYAQVVSLLAPLRDQLKEDPATLDLLGGAYLAVGRVKEGQEVLGELVKGKPDDLVARGQLAVSRAGQAGTREEGIHELEKVVESDPKSSRLDLVLISFHLRNGDYDRAIAAATRMMGKEPNNPLPLTIRGAAKLSKADDSGASEDFAAALVKAPDYTPASLYQAEVAVRNGDVPKARQIIDQVLTRNPADVGALMARGRIEQRVGQFAAAVPFYDRAVAAAPKDLEPRSQLIDALLATQDTARLTTVANDLVRTMPDNPSALDVAGKALAQAGRKQDSAALYQKLSLELPKSPVAAYRLGVVSEQAGDLDAARAAFDHALSVSSDFMPGWIARLNLEKREKGLDAAVAMARKAAKDHPQNEGIRLLEGDILAGAERWPDAEAFFRKQLAEHPSPAVSFRLFEALKEGGDSPKALRFMTEWLANHPDDATGRFQLAEGQMKGGDYKDAAVNFAALLKKAPHNLVILNNLAWIYGELKDPRALDTARQAYEAAPADGQVQDTYGELLHQSGDLKQALKLLSQAHFALPQDPEVTLHLAQARSDDKDRDGALALLRPLVEAKQAFPKQDVAKKLYAQLGGI